MGIMDFTFSTDVVDQVIKEIDKANKYVRIAVFQIHRISVFDAIKRALNRHVKVEILTLPFDSINADIRSRVSSSLEEVRALGADLHFSRWNIGDPERTTTAVGRWYSYHGKFIVTENAAIALSANMMDDEELDAILKYDDPRKIEEFNSKFNELIELFAEDGIRELIRKNYSDPESLFSPPRTITEEGVRKHWIIDYPSSICPKVGEIKNKLYLAPLDFRARDLYSKVMAEANEFIYVSTESFTDTDIMPLLITLSVGKKNIKILTGSNTQDFNDRIRNLYPQMIANNVEMRKPPYPLHAKLLITDKKLVVSSVNLNKMNLGFGTAKKFWRGNTESITIEDNESIIHEAKLAFEEIFWSSQSILEYFADKEKRLAKSIFEVFNVRATPEVRKLFSQVIVKYDVRQKKQLYEIGRYASILLRKYSFGRNVVDKSDFVSAMVLHFLSEHKHSMPELTDKILEVSPDMDTARVLERLINYKLIEADEGYYKINITELLGE